VIAERSTELNCCRRSLITAWRSGLRSTGELQQVLPGTYERDSLLDTDIQGRCLFVGTADDDVDIWYMGSGHLCGTLRGHRHAITAITGPEFVKVNETSGC
jgi:hypothetical protein